MREPDPRGVAWKKVGLVIGQHHDTSRSRTFKLQATQSLLDRPLPAFHLAPRYA
jgi:hypothetical protein